MRIRRQDLSVLLFYGLGYSTVKNLVLRLQRKPVTRFVAFHDIPVEASGNFEANLRFLKRCTNVVSLEDFLSGRLSSESINTVITFDDGYKGWVSDALPILKELELPATFFISSGFVGLSKQDEAEFIRSKLQINHKTTGGLNFEEVRRIAVEGFTVGGHTLNHCNLATLRDNVQLKYEIAEDKIRLERIIGKKIDYFAYPSGAFQNSNINLSKVLEESGYKGAVTTVSGFNIAGSNSYLLNRELTRASMPGLVFRARVYGNYDAVWFIKKRVLRVLQRRPEGSGYAQVS